jgi:hypothetical protein
MTDNARTGTRAPSTSVEFIGPREARVMLSKAAPNRKINDELVLKYACVMLEGDWRNIGVPLILDEHGRLSDGQHRLSAVIESETVQQFNVVDGVPHADALLTVDTGRKRSVGDILQIISNDLTDPRVFTNINSLFSVARRVWAYENYEDMNTNIVAARWMTTAKWVDFVSATSAECQEGVSVGAKVYSHTGMTLSGAGAAHVVCHREYPDLADEFADEIVKPSQVANPAYVLREAALRNAQANRRGQSWVKDSRICAAMYIKAFNCYKIGAIPKQIRFSGVGPAAESFPTVVQ